MISHLVFYLLIFYLSDELSPRTQFDEKELIKSLCLKSELARFAYSIRIDALYSILFNLRNFQHKFAYFFRQSKRPTTCRSFTFRPMRAKGSRTTNAYAQCRTWIKNNISWKLLYSIASVSIEKTEMRKRFPFTRAFAIKRARLKMAYWIKIAWIWENVSNFYKIMSYMWKNIVKM